MRWGTYRRSLLVSLVASISAVAIGTWPVPASASSPGFCGKGVSSQVLTSIQPAPNGGYWLQQDDISTDSSVPPRVATGTYAINGAPTFDSIPQRGTIVAAFSNFAPINGYYVVTDNGEIIPRGDAVSHPVCNGRLSNCTGYPSNPDSSAIIVAAATTWSGDGMWALDRKGRLWTIGDAQSFGDVRNHKTVPTGIAATPSGKGYYIVEDDGGLFAFGDAIFFGRFPKKITGIAVDVNVDCDILGYWLVTQGGGVHQFGTAPFYGSTGGGNICDFSVVGMTAIPLGFNPPNGPACMRTNGYAIVTARGSITQFTATGAVDFPPPTVGVGSQPTEITDCGTEIDTPGEYTVAQSLTSTSATVDCIDIDSPGVSLGLDNSTLSGPGGSGVTAAGIRIPEAAHGVQLFMLGATIEGFGVGIEDHASGVVISAAPTGGEILQNAARGILVSHADDVVIDSVASEQNGASGIELDHANGVTVRGVPIVQENEGYGLRVHSSTHNQFFNQDAFGNKLTGIYVGESATDQLSANARDGDPSTENVFLSCGVVQNGGAGIFPDFGDNRNTVSECIGQSNTDKDAIDGTPACKNNLWIDNSFVTTNRSCIQ